MDSTFTPTSCAASRFWKVARKAFPILVYLIRQWNRRIAAAEAKMIKNRAGVTAAPRTKIVSPAKGFLMLLGAAPHRYWAMFVRKMDSPMVTRPFTVESSRT